MPFFSNIKKDTYSVIFGAKGKSGWDFWSRILGGEQRGANRKPQSPLRRTLDASAAPVGKAWSAFTASSMFHFAQKFGFTDDDDDDEEETKEEMAKGSEEKLN